MFIKLLKHEFFASYRRYIPVYVSILVLAILSAPSGSIHTSGLGNVLFMILYIGFLVAAGVITLYNIIVSVGTRMFGKPGYLLFTTPASILSIIVIKVLANLLWMLVTGIVFVFSLFLFMIISGLFDFSSFIDGLKQLLMNWDWGMFSTLSFSALSNALYVIVFFLFVFTFVNTVYTGEKRLLIGIVLYIALNFITSLLQSIVAGILGMDTIYGGMGISMVFSLLGGGRGPMWINGSIQLILATVLFLFSWRLIETKLELK